VRRGNPNDARSAAGRHEHLTSPVVDFGLMVFMLN
jgi:hypothetical protein